MKTKDFKPQAWMLPQPVLIIGTYNADGTPNAMNAAWGGQWDYKEIMISMGSHATTDNLHRCGDFTIAFATEQTMIASDFVGIVSGRKQPDKIAQTGWHHHKGSHVDAPIFEEFPMTLECRIKEKIDQSDTGFFLIAEIVNIVCDEKYLGPDGKPDLERMSLITFDPIHNGYIVLGPRVGNAFADGRKLVK